MNRKPEEKFITLYDTAKKCLLIIDYLYSDLERMTLRATDATNVKADSSIVIRIYVAALGLIDYLHRFHEIVRALPLLRKDLTEIKKLKDSLSPIQDCRNYLQHMRGDLMQNDPINYSILGSMSWIHEDKNFTLISNQVTEGQAVPGIKYDRFTGKYVCKYQFIISNYGLQFDIIYTEVKLFWTWLEKTILIEPPQIKEYSWGEPTIVYSKFNGPQQKT